MNHSDIRVWRRWASWLACVCLVAACESPPTQRAAPSEPSSAPASSPRSSAASQKAAEELEGPGADGRYHFKLTLVPEVPGLGEMFKTEVLLTDVKTGAVVTGAEVKVDASMPEHRHGMMTAPIHKALGEGRYLTEGMKLHMPGSWELRVDAKGESGEDHIKLRYDQRPVAKE